METVSPERTTTSASDKESSGGFARVSVVWSRVILGFLLSAAGGAAFGHAWTVQVATWWWLGAISLLAGALLLLSVAYARRSD